MSFIITFPVRISKIKAVKHILIGMSLQMRSAANSGAPPRKRRVRMKRHLSMRRARTFLGP